MRYRVDELARRAGMTVDTVRFYQGKGLLAAPLREGRVAWYSDDHLAQLERIRDLKSQGFTLASIKRLHDGNIDGADAALMAALVRHEAGPARQETLIPAAELSARTGVSTALLAALQRERLLIPAVEEPEAMFTPGDVELVSSGIELLGAGLPLSELLSLARAYDAAATSIAQRAVDLFDEFIREPIRASASSEEEAGERLVDAFARMLPAVTTLIAQHFQSVLLTTARARIEARSDGS